MLVLAFFEQFRNFRECFRLQMFEFDAELSASAVRQHSVPVSVHRLEGVQQIRLIPKATVQFAGNKSVELAARHFAILSKNIAYQTSKRFKTVCGNIIRDCGIPPPKIIRQMHAELRRAVAGRHVLCMFQLHAFGEMNSCQF